MKHLINCLQIERFAHSISHDIIILLAQHSHTKREKEKAILQKNLFFIQDGDYGITGLSLLYYYKSILVTLLTNIYITLSIVNST